MLVLVDLAYAILADLMIASDAALHYTRVVIGAEITFGGMWQDGLPVVMLVIARAWKQK